MKKTFELCSGVKLTIIGGVFLAASLALMLLKIECPIDPAWVTVVICGYPLVYHTVWRRTIHNEGMGKISSAHLRWQGADIDCR